MQSDRRLRVALWALLVGSVCFAPSALAQYSGEAGGPGGGTSDLVNSGGTTDVVSRYNKATKGRSLTEWVKHLGDEDPVRRLDAVKSLGDSNDPKAIDYLIQAVNDPDPRVESKAVDYLGKLHAADSTPFLIQKLVTVGTRDRLRHRIVMTLGKIGDPRASRPLLQYVMQDGNPDIRGAGIFALGEIGDQSIREDLQRFSDYEDDPRLKRLAGEALTKIATRQLAPPPRKPSTFPTALDAALATDQR
jgi:HEAT repeat protein